MTAPTRRGFGSTIIEQSIPFDLGGKAEVQYRPSGLFVHLNVPARHIAGLARGGNEPSRNAPKVVDATPLHGKRVLLWKTA